MERRSPYQGLHAFGEEDQAFFGGRARDVRLIVANLFASRVTLLYGPSGVGKSSVLHAGVLPRLREHKDVLPVSVREWSEDPVRSIGEAVARAAGRELRGDLGDLLDACVADERRRVMLVLDQFEHALTERGTEDPLVESVSAVLRRPGLPVSVLIAIREESLADLDRFKGRLPGLFDTVLRLEYLDREAGVEAIRRPLAAWEKTTGEHVEAEDALVDAVLDAVPAGRAARGIETAQLQLVMTSVWDAERAEESAELRSRTFRALGGADGIVRAHVRDALDGLVVADRELAAVSLDRLVTPSGARIAHRSEDLADYAGVDAARLRPVLEHLSDARVLRPVAAGGPGGARFEVYHELLADAVLAWLTARTAERRAAEAGARLRRRVRNLGLAGAVLFLLVVALGLLLYAESERANSRSRELSATARRLLAANADPQAILALAVEAARTSRTREAEIALRAALAQSHERTVLRSRAGGVRSVDFSRDGRTLLTAEGDGGVRIWDRARAQSPRALAATGAVQAAFCPDEQRVAVAGDRGAALLAGSRRRRLARDPVEAIACSTDGTRVAIRDPDGARVFDARTGRRIATLQVPSNGTLGRVALSADGRHVAAPTEGGTAVFDLRGRRRRIVLRAPPSASDEEVTSVAFSPDGRRVLTGGADGAVLVWDLTTRSPVTGLEGHESLVSSVAYDPQGTLVVSAAGDRTARVWDGNTGVQIAVLRGHEGNLRSAVFAPDGRTVATASDDRTLRLWQTPVSAVLRAEGDLGYGAFTRNGRHVVTATGDGTIEVWDAPSGRRTARLAVPSAVHVAAAPGAKRVAVVEDDGRVRAWDPARPRTPATLASPADPVLAVDYSPDGGAIALATEGGAIRLVDPSGRALLEFRDAALGPLSAVAFSPDGRRIAAAAGIANEIVLMDARSGRRIRRIRPPDPGLTTVAFSPDGAELIAGGNDGAWIWDAVTGQLRLRLRGHLTPVQSANFSGGGELVATASLDGEARVWDTATGDLLTVLSGRTASFGGDRFILTTGAGPSARLHTCDACGRPAALESRGRSRITRPLTDAQLESYVGG